MSEKTFEASESSDPGDYSRILPLRGTRHLLIDGFTNRITIIMIVSSAQYDNDIKSCTSKSCRLGGVLTRGRSELGERRSAGIYRCGISRILAIEFQTRRFDFGDILVLLLPSSPIRRPLSLSVIQ